jgi:acetyl/propionyl-CoA carboxylase alpha subunit
MTVYYVSVGKNEYKIEINNNQFKINGEAVQATLVALQERGLFLLRHGTWKRELHVQAQGNRQYTLDVNGRHAVAKVEKGIGHEHHKSHLANAGDLIAPMPGIVVSVQVVEGELVEAGQVLVVLESMKMQMILRASCAGKVIQVNAKPNLQFAKDALLVKIDPLLSCDD